MATSNGCELAGSRLAGSIWNSSSSTAVGDLALVAIEAAEPAGGKSNRHYIGRYFEEYLLLVDVSSRETDSSSP